MLLMMTSCLFSWSTDLCDKKSILKHLLHTECAFHFVVLELKSVVCMSKKKCSHPFVSNKNGLKHPLHHIYKNSEIEVGTFLLIFYDALDSERAKCFLHFKFVCLADVIQSNLKKEQNRFVKTILQKL